MQRVIILAILVVLLAGCAEAKNVLVTIAHPDDESIGMAGLLQRHASEGDNIVIYVFTDGAADEKNMTEAVFETRKAELYKAMELIGINNSNIHFLKFDDLNFISDLGVEGTYKTINSMSQIISTLKPDITYTHAYEHGHIDHDSVHYITQRAWEKNHSGKIYEFFEYFYGDGFNGTLPKERARPDYYTIPVITLDMRDVEIKTKKKMLSVYTSQDINGICNESDAVEPSENCTASILKTYYKGADLYRESPNYDYTSSPCKDDSCRYRNSQANFYEITANVDEQFAREKGILHWMWFKLKKVFSFL